MRLFNPPQRRILSNFQVDRFGGAASVMSHRARHLFPGANVSIVCSASSVEHGRVPKQVMDDEGPGRLVRQGTFPLGRSSLRKSGSLRRTKSYRVTFASKTTANDGESIEIVPPVTPPGRDFKEKRSSQKSESKTNTSKTKIANRKKPARRPTSHVPNAEPRDDDGEQSDEEGTSTAPKTGRRTSITQLFGQTVITPMEEKLRQLAMKYRKKEEPPRSRIPVATYKSNRVTTLTQKFERQFSNEHK